MGETVTFGEVSGISGAQFSFGENWEILEDFVDKFGIPKAATTGLTFSFYQTPWLTSPKASKTSN